MTAPPPLKHPFTATDQEYRARDALWHLRELSDIRDAVRHGRHINLGAALGRAAAKD